MVDGRLKGKVAIITGAGSGIGLESAVIFVREGAAVVLSDISEEAGQQAVTKINELFPDKTGKFIFKKCDVACENQVSDLVDFAVKEFGGLNVMFNNAGIMHSKDGNVDETEDSIWDLTFSINAKGVWYGCKHAIRAMRQSGGGSIINTASFVALMGAATPQIAYTASKGAVLAMSRELAVTHARENIRVNAVCPGPLETPLLMKFLDTKEKLERRRIHIPMGRFGQAREIAAAVLFLASDESSFVTGTDFLVDGGITSAYVTPLDPQN